MHIYLKVVNKVNRMFYLYFLLASRYNCDSILRMDRRKKILIFQVKQIEIFFCHDAKQIVGIIHDLALHTQNDQSVANIWHHSYSYNVFS